MSDQNQSDGTDRVPLNEALRLELLSRMARDQKMRQAVLMKYPPGTPHGPEDLAWWSEVDAENTARMKEIVATYGWPGWSLVSDDGARAAWLLVQHADEDVPFQKQCLGLLESAVTAGEASAQDLAYLTDRVRLHEGRPQVYGTQSTWVYGKPTLAEIEDPAQVNERRAAVGLEPLAEPQPLRFWPG